MNLQKGGGAGILSVETALEQKENASAERIQKMEELHMAIAVLLILLVGIVLFVTEIIPLPVTAMSMCVADRKSVV